MLEEYNVSFIIKRPKRPPQLITTYFCLSEENFKSKPHLTRKELITRNSTFLLKDRFQINQNEDVVIKLLKIVPLHSAIV